MKITTGIYDRLSDSSHIELCVLNYFRLILIRSILINQVRLINYNLLILYQNIT